MMALMFGSSIIAMVALAIILSFELEMKQREAARELDLEKQRGHATNLANEKTPLL
jgi:hypothetical protein